jgi:hypothetical protein
MRAEATAGHERLLHGNVQPGDGSCSRFLAVHHRRAR